MPQTNPTLLTSWQNMFDFVIYFSFMLSNRLNCSFQIIIQLLGAFANVARIPAEGPFFETACERTLARLSCNDGSLIRVDNANYGRLDRET